jgi:transcriptional regulator with XRE-family HTH domain
MKKSDIRQVFGRNLEQIMEKRGINQQRLSELSGLSPGHISEARRGISAIGLDALAILAHALQVLPVGASWPTRKPPARTSSSAR